MRARLRASLSPRRPSAQAGRGKTPARAGRSPGPLDEPDGADTFEWRMRESDGPIDLGHYACACGFEFAARVETGVCCPHCGAGQAW